MSTLPYYSKTNIGSRPSKRNNSSSLIFSDLRAIPFVGSWSQLKQNVPGFFGVGSAIEELDKKGEIKSVKKLFKNSLFFRTLVFNSMMSLTKSFFQLTAYMKEDKEFGLFWELIYKEYLLTNKLLLEVSEFKSLMENEPAGKESIKAREEIVQPLLTIQQFALIEMQKLVEIAEDLLSNGNDLDDFGILLDQTWQLKRSLESSITPTFIDEIYSKGIHAGALGGKLLGAGGGGFIIFYVNPEYKQSVLDALKNFLVVPFKIDFNGTQLMYSKSQSYSQTSMDMSADFIHRNTN